MKKIDQTKVGFGHRPKLATVAFAHKNTKRARTRRAQNRKAIAWGS